MILLLSLFISTSAQRKDCYLSDGYIRGHMDNVTDNCDQECGWLQCGDVCIRAVIEKWCFCGEKRLELYKEPYYCCVDPSPDNRTQCWMDRYGFGHCPQGRVISMDDTCNNNCFNDYDTSAVVGPLSMYRCIYQCVVASPMCQGYNQCRDFRDISKCNEDLKCPQAPGYSQTVVLVSDLSGGHYYCDKDISHNDGQYDTITREDETDLNISSRKVQINYTSITECKTDHNLPGLMCGERCSQHSTWCWEDSGSSCGKYNFSTNNKQLCANTTFWDGKSCDIFYMYSGDRKAAVGRRCTGATQHCS